MGSLHAGLIQTYIISRPSCPYNKHFGAIDHLTLWISLLIFLFECTLVYCCSLPYFVYLFILGKEKDLWILFYKV